MTINVGDWVVNNEYPSTAFRVCGIIQTEDFEGFYVDKWGTMHNPIFFRKYKGAVSALEAAEEGKDEFYRRVGRI